MVEDKDGLPTEKEERHTQGVEFEGQGRRRMPKSGARWRRMAKKSTEHSQRSEYGRQKRGLEKYCQSTTGW